MQTSPLSVPTKYSFYPALASDVKVLARPVEGRVKLVKIGGLFCESRGVISTSTIDFPTVMTKLSSLKYKRPTGN